MNFRKDQQSHWPATKCRNSTEARGTRKENTTSGGDQVAFCLTGQALLLHAGYSQAWLNSRFPSLQDSTFHHTTLLRQYFRLLPTGKYQSAVSTTSSSPGQNPDTPWGDRETSCGLPTGTIVTLHGRPWQFSAIKLIQSSCSRGGDVPRPGPPAATSRELPSQTSSCQPPAVDANVHLPADNKQPVWSVIAKTRAATFWTKLSSAARKSPKLSLHQNHFLSGFCF